MAETRSAKKRKINDASSGNAGGEHRQLSAGDSKIDSGDELSDVIQMMKAMQKEMKKMQRKMGKWRKGYAWPNHRCVLTTRGSPMISWNYTMTSTKPGKIRGRLNQP
mmetsp:Transcript_18780/g.33981  ORF Transcript_18780/g.33981 Transcript_18780/m.33981 type:complete len:107 (-) Transcript_18780:966-1286(-)